MIFVGEKNFNYNDSRIRGLPIVPVAPDNIIQSVLRYLIEHRLDGNTWFLLAQDDSYVRLRELEGFLSRLDPSRLHYVGRWATGRASEAAELGLKPHERYCLGSSGIVLSSALVYKLEKSLKQCWSMDDGDGRGIPEDVALGKCISRNLDIQCSQDQTVSSLYPISFCTKTLISMP